MVALTRGGRSSGENLDSGSYSKLAQQDFPVDWIWGKTERRAQDDSKGFGLCKLD